MMFDVNVSWTDPDRETVAEHRIRTANQNSAGNELGMPGRLTRRPSVFSFLHSKKKYGSKFDSKSILSISRSKADAESQYSPTRSSSPNSIVHSEARGMHATRDDFQNETPEFNRGVEKARSSQYRLSAFSEWATRSSISDASTNSLTDFPGTTQTWAQSQLITQSTVVTVSTNQRDDDIDPYFDPAPAVRIFSDNTEPPPWDSSRSPTLYNTGASTKSYTSTPTKDNFRLPSFPARWKAPKDWASPAEDSESSMSPGVSSLAEYFQRQPESNVDDDDSSSLTDLQKDIQMKLTASPKIMLDHLRDDWDFGTDSSFYQEIDTEVQLWMLTALRSMIIKEKIDKGKGGENNEKDSQSSNAPVSKPPKHLCLYENDTCASYLSSHYTHTEIHSLSTDPFPEEVHPNIYPIRIPLPTTQLPYASNTFSTIFGLTLPARLPSSSIPPLLKDCHRKLISPSHDSREMGKMHLMIIDPYPSPRSMGCRLQAWLEENLIINLERDFRCLNPTRVFPLWLADAGLNGEGSNTLKFRFDVFQLSPRTEDMPSTSDEDELKSVVGRWLWRNNWGSFVKGHDKWWWEDVDIMEECRAKGTFWEYSITEAYKAD